MAVIPSGSRVVRIRFNYKAFNAVRRSAGVVADLQRRGQAIADAAGVDGVEVTTTYRGTRARVYVSARSFEARRAEASDKVLTRAIGAGRG